MTSTGSGLAAVQQQVDHVQSVMQENVNVMVENLDKAEHLEGQSAALAVQAKAFHKTSRATRRHFFWQLCRQRLVIAGVCGVIVIVGLICIIVPYTSGGRGGSDGGGGAKGSTTVGARVATGSHVNRSSSTLVDWVQYAEGFFDEDEALASASPNATYRDSLGPQCAHELLQVEPSGRLVSSTGNLEEGDLGFTSYYVDSLGADGSAPLHSGDSTGARIGLEVVPGGRHAYALRAAGIDGLLVVCTRPVTLRAPSVRAEATVYVAQAGWHEAADELRAWADLGDRSRPISLLPGCAPRATRENVDVMGLRSSPAPGVAYTGKAFGEADPALLNDTWHWRTLQVDLGQVDSSVAVCVGLQSGAGAEEVYVDELRLLVNSSSGAGGAARAGCEPSSQLTPISRLPTLAVRGSCPPSGPGGGTVAAAAICSLLAVAALGFLAHVVLSKEASAVPPEVLLSRPHAAGIQSA